jgi:glycosyltransferase involved in cell wall biosynthesis
LENAPLAGVDLRYPEKGNPGIGGSEYMMVMIADQLSKNYGDLIEVSILAADISRLPAACSSRYAASFQEAVEQAARDSVEILVFHPRYHSVLDRVSILESHPNLKGVAWAHNSLVADDWDALERSKSIAMVINVGQEELDFYRDHRLFYKSTVINNCLHSSAFDEGISALRTNNRVVYMGSLVEDKGFHLLARSWRKILAQVPHAELHVVGSGRLYGRNNLLGRWGIAEGSFEESFMPYLLDGNGSLLPSVKFHGILGAEKREILASAAVGVVNPSGKNETFCICAVEFQAHRVAVVSARDWGLLDTVQHKKTGLLCRNEEELISNVVRLLRDVRLRRELGEAAYGFARSHFNVQSIVHEWYRLLVAVHEERRLPEIPMKPNILCRKKLLKEIVRRLKLVIPVLQRLRPIQDGRLRSIPRYVQFILSRGMSDKANSH